jgi:hypothetical protein
MNQIANATGAPLAPANETILKTQHKIRMATRNKWACALLVGAFVLVTDGRNALGQQPQQQTSTGTVNVNDLANKPNEHLGQVQLVGVVAAVSQGEGFVLVDKREYADCGLSCLAEPATKKVPVRWSGDAPKLEQTVHVAGTLSQSTKGLSLVAQEVSIQ